MRRMLARGRALSLVVAAFIMQGLPAGTVAQSNEDAEYFQLGENEPTPGLAPGLAVTDFGRVTNVAEVRMTAGDEVMSGLLEYVEAKKPWAGHMTGIGGFESAVFAWYDPDRRAFKKIPVDMKGEVVSFTGSVSFRNGTAQVHAHAVISLADGTTRGGHLVSAKISPIMQVFVFETEEGNSGDPAHTQNQGSPYGAP